jgi:NADPH:quinone reductase-like Zn-dependent oxidoreductase
LAPRRPPSTTRSALKGVTHAIDYRSQDFEAEVMRITNGEGVDLIIDALRPNLLPQGLPAAAPGGRLVMYGLSENSKGGKRSIPLTLKSMAAMPTADDAVVEELDDYEPRTKGSSGSTCLKWWDRRGQSRPG